MELEQHHHFDNWETLNAAFAGNLTGNLAIAEKKLDLKLVARDHWVKVISPSEKKITRAIEFLRELHQHFKRLDLHCVPQPDFEQILEAFVHDRQQELQELFTERIKVGPGKCDILPRRRNQLNYVRNIRTREIVFGIGPAGTGKTYLAMAAAVSDLLEHKHARIILTRPAREAGENLGFLPGNLEEKIMPYLRPLYDALYDMLDFDEVSSLIERNIIEVAPLAFMRGRTLNNAFIILDEAQNTTVEQMLMFLTRIGFNSRCVITGDPSQTDLTGKEKSGLLEAGRVLKGIREIGFTYFTTQDIVRHALIEKIIHAFNG